MSEEIKPKKERKFLKTLGKIGMILLEEIILKLGSSLIKKIGGKKTLPSILFLLLSFASYAAVDSIPYPITGNKQRLGFQTTGNGLVYRGRAADTITKPSSYVDKNVKAYLILDSVRGTIFVWKQTFWDSLKVGVNSFDTTTLNLVNRFALKLNISDTAAMLSPYAKKSYVDTAGRFYARQDFSNVTTSTLTWTQTDTLIPAGVNVVQVYRNGQILLPSQYTIPTKTSVIIAATSFKVGENYTVIFPKGGGGSGSGSGSLTSISGGTGITVSPDPITTTGTVSADLTVLMELTDTVTLSNRINTKLNATDTASLSSRINLKLNATDTASLSSRINLKLNSADTASLSNRINLKGSGTVTSIAMGYGIASTQSPLTTSGTLRIDSSVIFSRIRDSIVDVAIGNDTIKIIKQEYAPALSSDLTFTVLPKFPIQLKAFILVFRNGQLLNNEQYNLTDTNKITIVLSSFKLGSNYTVVTVSGIGSVGSAQGNPVYPEAGIAVSTGTTWTTSIPNNSSNWNIAFNDKITNAAFTGTNTKTLTLTQYDGGTFTPTFTDLQGVTSVAAGTGLTGGTITTTGTVAVDFTTVAPLANPTFTGTVSGISKTMVGLGNVDNTTDANKPVSTATQTALDLKQNTLTNPVTGTGTTNTLPLFTGASIIGNSVIQESSGNIGIGTTPFASLTLGQGKNIMLDASSNNIAKILFYETAARNENDVQFGAKIQYNSPSDRLEFVTRDSFSADPSGDELAISILRQTGNTTIHKTLDVTGATTLGSTLAVTGAITEGGNNVLTNLDTASLSSRIDLKLNKTDTASLSSRIDGKVSLTGTETIDGAKTFSSAITAGGLTLTSTISGTNQLLGLNSIGGAVGQIKIGNGLNLTSDTLNLSTVSIANGGTGANSASVARSTLDLGYVFATSTAGSSITLSSNRVSIVNTGGASATSIDLTTATNGRQYMIKNLATGTVISTASNVIPYTGGSAGTAILSAGNVTPQWVTLVADGTNWHIMQKN